MTTFPVLRYRDARAAIDWLGEAFGFTEKEVHEGEDGTIVHAELYTGKGIVMLSTDRDDDGWGAHAGNGWAYLVVDDPDALHERAVAAGAEIIRPLEDTDYGSRDFSARDPEGNRWSFGTYAP
ncbi:MAG: VOC family protein [Solirubrobacteraceae bacterium]